MSEIKIQLNGKEVICDSSQTILQVAEKQGLDIPNMCHDKKLEPFGSCWVCLVEVKGARQSTQLNPRLRSYYGGQAKPSLEK